MQKPFRNVHLQIANICAQAGSDLLDSAGYAADTSCIDRSCARTRFSSNACGGERRSLGGNYESHVSRACASVVGLRWMSNNGAKLRPSLQQPVWSILWICMWPRM